MPYDTFQPYHQQWLDDPDQVRVHPLDVPDLMKLGVQLRGLELQWMPQLSYGDVSTAALIILGGIPGVREGYCHNGTAVHPGTTGVDEAETSWHESKLSALATAVGNKLNKDISARWLVTNGLVARAQRFPYRTKNNSSSIKGGLCLPSMRPMLLEMCNRFLPVSAADGLNMPFLVVSGGSVGYKEWEDGSLVFSKAAEYGLLHTTRSTQQHAITQGNLPEGVFASIVDHVAAEVTRRGL